MHDVFVRDPLLIIPCGGARIWGGGGHMTFIEKGEEITHHSSLITHYQQSIKEGLEKIDTCQPINSPLRGGVKKNITRHYGGIAGHGRLL